jgi:hypothetical protein
MTTKKAMAKATADPCGMTTRRQKQQQQMPFGQDKRKARAWDLNQGLARKR